MAEAEVVQRPDQSDLSTPSRFWERLGAEHERVLGESGPEWLKRKQALRYFTWRWRWPVIFSGEQMRFLLAHTSPVTWVRCASTPTILSDAAWTGVSWSRFERWSYSFATRMLWEYGRKHDTLGTLKLDEPSLGNPFPVRWRGRLISQDLANSALEAAAIGRALGNATPRTFLEIGAGYGRTAYVLLSLFPKSTYTIVDIEPALSLSKWYLTQLFPPERLRFLAPGEATELAKGSADVALSISSLQEMTARQVGQYVELLTVVAAGGIVYLKQLALWSNPDDDVRSDFAAYPIPSTWVQIFREIAPVQTSFRQAAWRLPT